MPIPTDELKDQIDHLADSLRRLADSQAAIKDDINRLRLDMIQAFTAQGERLREDHHALREELKKDQYALRDEWKKDQYALRDELTQAFTSQGAMLKEDHHALREELKEDHHSLRHELTQALAAQGERLARFESKVLTTLSIVKWVGSILGGIAVLALINAVWWAGNLTAEVRILTDEVRARKPVAGTLKSDVSVPKKFFDDETKPKDESPTPREVEATGKSARTDTSERAATPAKSATGAEAQPMPFIPSGRKD